MKAAIPLGCLCSSCSGCRSLANDCRQVGQEVSFSNQDLRQELHHKKGKVNLKEMPTVTTTKPIHCIYRLCDINYLICCPELNQFL